MTPKEKAKQLLEKYSFVEIAYYTSIHEVKQCALIAVEEILKVACPDTFACKSYDGEFYSDQEYFEQVKKEIEKL